MKEPGGDGRHCWWMCELGGEGVRARPRRALYIEADRAQFTCHPAGNLLVHSTWWMYTRRRNFAHYQITRIATKNVDDMCGRIVSDNNAICSL